MALQDIYGGETPNRACAVWRRQTRPRSTCRSCGNDNPDTKARRPRWSNPRHERHHASRCRRTAPPTTGWSRYPSRPPNPANSSSRSGPSGSAPVTSSATTTPRSTGATASGPPPHRNVIPGHELVGTIVHIDDQSRQRWGVDIGDRVVSDRSCHAGTAGSARYAPQQCSYPGRRSPSSGRASSGRWEARRGSRCGTSGTAWRIRDGRRPRTGCW